MKQFNFSSVLKNSKGQVALFVALIFQVLFVFFAMIVNVGLLVHHKINLQNSVDLAAYYGAMKQAEMLNAISHVNYQIRQSYKLLTFRYQQLGSAGTVGSGQHPYVQSGPSTGNIVREEDKALPYDTSFCIPYTPVDIVGARETYCKEINALNVPTPGVPNFGASTQWTDFQNGIIQLATTLKQEAQGYCRYAMGTNWLTLAKFIATYKIDVRNRKKLLLGLANEISKEEPRDIQGDSIKEGVYKTLYRNLSYPNQESLASKYGTSGTGAGGGGGADVDFKFVNSLSMGECAGNPTELVPPGWLKEVFIFPVYAVHDGDCNGDVLAFKPTYFNVSATPSISPNIPAQSVAFAQKMAELATEFPGSSGTPEKLLYRSTIGFEKNPWCVGYVGVSATTKPKIPFSPFGAVTMKATAFAKPFGGRIGPWYGTTWPAAAEESDGTKQTDAVMPMRVKPELQIGGFNPAELKQQKKIFPNHSRFLGDDIGVLSELTISHFAKAIYQKLGSVSLLWYDHIFDQDFDNKGMQGDPLAWDKVANKAPTLRDLEIAAVAPDQFDTATYSIDPDFYQNYLLKIEKGYGNQFQFLLRGDLGSRMQGTAEEKRFSVRNQIMALNDPAKNMIDAQSKLTYYLNQFYQVLTSWQQKTPDEYVLDPTRFGKCSAPIEQTEDEKFYAGGSCKAGGRTGYSVKLVNGKFLKNEVKGAAKQYELGGKGISGMIKNPAPDL